MIKCSYCEKEINVGFNPQTGETYVMTKYWQGDGNNRKYYCDAKCSLDAHEQARNILRSLGEEDG